MVIVTLAGGAALGLGIVILVDAWPTQLHHWFNADHRDGVLFLIAGAVAIGAAITSPVVLAPAASPSPQQPELASPPELTPAPDSPHPKPGLVPAPDAS
jgi:hypothetical protein